MPSTYFTGLRTITMSLVIAFGTASAGCAQAVPAGTSPGSPARSFKECVEKGGKILKSYPAQCVSADGTRFFDDEVKRQPARGCKNVCGNGVCDEVVCFMLGCPCAESAESCPQDCKEN